MGRLQRKKASGAKKKKKRKDSSRASAPVPNLKDAGSKNVALVEAQEKSPKTAKASPSKKQAQVSRTVAAKTQSNFITASVQFLREVKIELKKVTWPSRKQTIGSTVVVIALVILISLFLGSIDIALSSLMRIVLK